VQEARKEAIDPAALKDLEDLGGFDFLRDLADQFINDAAVLLNRLHGAVETSDALRFREEIHALRSCAANVGAQQIYRLCLEWREASQADVTSDGQHHLQELTAAIDQACTELRQATQTRDRAA
jgi:two-component system sensor histidine kinase RpfC